MWNRKNSLDEMQQQSRNRIGNQMFMLMYWAIFINCGLSGIGITWLSHPSDVMIIITACMGIYLVRLIALNAFVSPQIHNKKMAATLIFTIVFSIVLSIAAANLFKETLAPVPPPAQDNSALILMTVSGAGLIATLVVSLIKKANNKTDSED